jgi:histidyl-tRNA synthetase
LGDSGVRLLLGKGRKDESGDFTKGADLDEEQIEFILAIMHSTIAIEGKAGSGEAYGDGAAFTPHPDFKISDRLFSRLDLKFAQGISDLSQIKRICGSSGYTDDRVRVDPTIVRGLEYYTGAVFEAQLQFPVQNEAGEEVVFGSVAGGGRYDDLVARFTGQQVPATGISIGVSRLVTALTARGLSPETQPLIVVLTIDDAARSFAMARELREAGLRAEAYVGTKKFGDQLKYADKRGAAIAIIEGADECAAGKITLKDMKRGAELSKDIESRAEWLGERQAQVTIDRGQLVPEVKSMLSRGRA